jgi:hypothetical protein
MERSIVVLKRDCTGPVARRQKTLAKCVIAYRVRYNNRLSAAQGRVSGGFGTSDMVDHFDSGAGSRKFMAKMPV